MSKITVGKLVNYLIERMLDLYSFVFDRAIFSRINNFLLFLSLRSLGFHSMVGEEKFVKYLCKQIDGASTIALDLGAHKGDYSKDLLLNSKHLRVIGFEPHPNLFPKLINNMSEFGNRFNARNLAVGSIEDKTIKLFDFDGAGTVASSLYKDALDASLSAPFASDKVIAHNVKVVTLDNELTEEEMRQVRFIKSDIEGSDKDALVGAKKLIEKAGNNLYAIQVEINEPFIYAGVFVREITELLPGFDVYRILPNGKLLSLANAPDYQREIFAYQNLVFLNKANKTKLY